MKNYLFAPFKDDEEKIESYNDLKEQLSYYIDKDNVDINLALNPITIFIGCLESYYDIIISELKAENVVAVADERIIKTLEKEIRVLKAETTQSKFFLKGEQVNTDALCNEINESREHYEEEIAELKAENERLNIALKSYQLENESLQDQLKECVSDYDNDIKASYELDDTHSEIIKRLEAELKESKEQYHMLASSRTSHYPKEYKAEADEYFHHNPQCKKLLFFILDGNDFDWDEDNDGCNGMNGEYNSILFADDCIAEFDNNEGSE